MVYQYMYSANGTMNGFTEHSLSFFNISNFPPGTGPTSTLFTGVSMCRSEWYIISLIYVLLNPTLQQLNVYSTRTSSFFRNTVALVYVSNLWRNCCNAAVTYRGCLCFPGIRTTETPHGHLMPTPSPNSIGLSWRQNWPLSYSSRYETVNIGI